MTREVSLDWFEQLQETVFVANAITVHGNISDFLLHSTGGSLQYSNIRIFFEHFLHDRGYDLVGHYDILDGLEFFTAEQLEQYESLVQQNESSSGGHDDYYHVPGDDEPIDVGSDATQDQDSGTILQMHSASTKDFFETFSRIRSIFNLKKCPSAAFILYYFDYFVGSPRQMDLSERSNLILLEKIINSARKIGNLPQLLVIVADDIGNVPAHLYFGNPRCRQLHIPHPGKAERKHLIHQFLGMFHGTDSEKDAPAIESLASFTEGLTNYDLSNLARLSARLEIPPSMARELVKQYKFGRKTSPWDELSRERILATPWKRLKKDADGRPLKVDNSRPQKEELPLNMQDCLKERVVGQDHAVVAMEDMVIRAVQGIQGARAQDIFSKPKGIFLFCGPTGVGKTELTKAFTEWLFGDENAMVRFDMSEFSQEHSDQKLIGAPPGYVGHEQGGQLTNAVKKKPFCVILFDEVDKMHHKNWDIFLQILEDGRLTDGTGDTVYFSETVIVMTSNIGGASQPEKGSIGKIRSHYLSSVRRFFRETLGRPEILNRIGMDNVIVFNPIGRQFQETIIWQKLNTVSLAYLEKNSIHLEFEQPVVDLLLNNEEGFARNGARGVENLITTHVINPLARYLFYNPDAEKSAALAVTIKNDPAVKTVFTTK